jgi:simple sugar transport system ATP-binding protein
MSSLLRVENLTKRFPGIVANDRLDLDVGCGEIHALLGENGAGKSTLMKMLYGMMAPDEGAIFWKEQRVQLNSPRDAIRVGIGMVHQHFMQVGALTVLENIALGRRLGLFADRKADEALLQRIVREFEQPLDPDAPLDSLSVGERQRVEIFKALFHGAELLILDEPTAVLSPPEVAKLFAACRRIAAQGRSVIFITHRLDEVEAVSDRITVLQSAGNRTPHGRA